MRFNHVRAVSVMEQSMDDAKLAIVKSKRQMRNFPDRLKPVITQNPNPKFVLDSSEYASQNTASNKFPMKLRGAKMLPRM